MPPPDAMTTCCTCPKPATWRVKSEQGQTYRDVCGVCLAVLLGDTALDEILRLPLRKKRVS
jgi:hypothetical protein